MKIEVALEFGFHRLNPNAASCRMVDECGRHAACQGMQEELHRVWRRMLRRPDPPTTFADYRVQRDPSDPAPDRDPRDPRRPAS